MGANAQTSVPAFTAGQILTAAQVTQINTGIPVFADSTARDAAFGGTGEKTLAEGQLAYLEDTNKVMYYNGSSWANLSAMTEVARFTTSGTWTVPAGVTYAIAHIRGGGGGTGAGAGAGGSSSVAFAGGTVTANGGAAYGGSQTTSATNRVAGAANSGLGAAGPDSSATFFAKAGDGANIVGADTVTPAAGITVTVGAGGTAGTNGEAGGSGFVWIEYAV